MAQQHTDLVLSFTKILHFKGYIFNLKYLTLTSCFTRYLMNLCLAAINCDSVDFEDLTHLTREVLHF